MWKRLNLDGDGAWIVDGLAKGSLVVVHDGSFMENVDRCICSAGGVIFCKESRHMAFFSATERTDESTASNYRGELLGGFMGAMIIWAAAQILEEKGLSPEFASDNMGVVSHGNNCTKSLKEAQSQADLIRCFRAALSELPFTVVYSHVYGHQDDTHKWSDLTLLQQLNVIADYVAKNALLYAARHSDFILPLYPFESF